MYVTLCCPISKRLNTSGSFLARRLSLACYGMIQGLISHLPETHHTCSIDNIYFAPWVWSMLIVCLSACSHNSRNMWPNWIFVHVACSRDSVLLWQHCDMLCTSGFMDDVMFSHHGTNGQTVLDKIRLQGTLTSSTLPKPPILSVTSDNYCLVEFIIIWHWQWGLLSTTHLFILKYHYYIYCSYFQLMAFFPGEPGLASLLLPRVLLHLFQKRITGISGTGQVFGHRLDVLPVTKPSVSKHWIENRALNPYSSLVSSFCCPLPNLW